MGRTGGWGAGDDGFGFTRDSRRKVGQLFKLRAGFQPAQFVARGGGPVINRPQDEILPYVGLESHSFSSTRRNVTFCTSQRFSQSVNHGIVTITTLPSTVASTRHRIS